MTMRAARLISPWLFQKITPFISPLRSLEMKVDDKLSSLWWASVFYQCKVGFYASCTYLSAMKLQIKSLGPKRGSAYDSPLTTV